MLNVGHNVKVNISQFTLGIVINYIPKNLTKYFTKDFIFLIWGATL